MICCWSRIARATCCCVSMLFLLSCNKFLDKKAESSLVIPNSLSALQALLDNNNIMNVYMGSGLAEVGTDDFYISGASYNALSELEKHAYTWQPDAYFTIAERNMNYSNIYRVVFNANMVLDQLKKMDDRNNETYNSIKGAALFFRAYAFYQLAQVYCPAYKGGDAEYNRMNLGLALRLSPNFEERSFRSSLEETYAQIEQDLLASVELLPDRAEIAMRPSKLASLAMLGRLYLTMGAYDKSLVYSDRALTLNAALMDYKDRNFQSATPFEILNPETIFLSYNATVFAIDPSIANVDTALYRSYLDDDLRKLLFFNLKSDGTAAFKGSYVGFYNSVFFNGIATDELYLIKAECLARQGQLELAKATLKSLLDKRYRNGFTFPETIHRQDAILSYILDERRKELLFRGLRWTDIRRLNFDQRFKKDLRRNLLLEGGEKTFELRANDKRFTFQLPEDVIQLSGMQQNPL